jgi:hypothetical protein
MPKYQLEQEREVTPQPSAFVASVVVPLAQCGLVGAMLALGALTLAVVITGDLTGWPVALVIGVLGFVILGAWRFTWDVRRPVLEWLEAWTGQDIDGDGTVGTTGRVPFTEAVLDRRARQVLRLASEGKSISRASLVPKMMPRGEWEALMARLVARGIGTRARDRSVVVKYNTFAEAWERYTNGPPGPYPSWWVDESDGLVSKE